MDNLVDKIKHEYNEFLIDHELFEAKGNKSAGTRARKALMNISKLCKEIRLEIQAKKNA